MFVCCDRRLGPEEKKRQQSILLKYCDKLHKSNVHLLKDLVNSWVDQDDTSLSHPYFYSSGTKEESATLVAVAYLAAGRTRAVEYVRGLLPKLPKYKEGPKALKTPDGRFASVMCHSPFMTERAEKSLGILSGIMDQVKGK
jgi:hypothetical protein